MNAEQFLQIADHFPEAALLVTRDGAIVAANRLAALGPLPKALTGRTLRDLTTTPAEAVGDYLHLCSRSREPVVGSLVLRAADDREIACRCYGAVVHHDPHGDKTRLLLRLIRKDSTPSHFTVLSQKIDELTKEIHRRRQAEEELRETVERHWAMAEYLTTLVEASATLTGTLEPSTVLASILQLSGRLLPADAYAIWRFHLPSDRWRIVLSSGLSDPFQQATIHILEQTPGMPETPVIADDVFALPMLAERKELYRAEGIRSLLVVPLRIHGSIGGTLVVYHRQPHRFSEIEVRVATAVANLSAAAIGSADLYEKRRRAEQDARFLSDASAALAALVDYGSTLQKVARLAVPFFADWCTVDMLDEGGTLRRLAVAHVDPSKVELAHQLHRRYPPDLDAPQGVGNILRTGKSEIVADITDEMLAASVPDAELLGIMRKLGLKSYMGVPLLLRGKALGVLTFIGAESGRRYDAADLAMAEDLAHRAAVAIENAQLYQAAREADRRKDEFLALLGHELRNPLAPIRNALHVLKLPGADAAIAQRARDDGAAGRTHGPLGR